MEENLKKEIKISEVLQLLQEGYTRDQIAVKYGISQKELKYLFQHPKLKGKKTIKGIGITIVDDLEEMPEIPEAAEAWEEENSEPQSEDMEQRDFSQISNTEAPAPFEQTEISRVAVENAVETMDTIELSN